MGREDKALKRERSIPVSSRVDIITLANMVKYFDSVGTRITSVSQLVSWCVELSQSAVRDIREMPKEHSDIEDAMRTMDAYQLRQPSLENRGLKKILTARRFENLRSEAVRPEEYVPGQYNTLHNKNSVQVIEFGSVEEELDNWDREYYNQKKITPRQALKATRSKKTYDDLEKVKEIRAKWGVEDKEPEKDSMKIVELEDQKGENVDHLFTEKYKAEREVKTMPPTTDIAEQQEPNVSLRKRTPEEIQATFNRIAEKNKKLLDDLDDACGLDENDR